MPEVIYAQDFGYKEIWENMVKTGHWGPIDERTLLHHRKIALENDRKITLENARVKRENGDVARRPRIRVKRHVAKGVNLEGGPR